MTYKLNLVHRAGFLHMRELNKYIVDNNIKKKDIINIETFHGVSDPMYILYHFYEETFVEQNTKEKECDDLRMGIG